MSAAQMDTYWAAYWAACLERPMADYSGCASAAAMVALMARSSVRPMAVMMADYSEYS